MYDYDILILGGGIAASSVAYNLELSLPSLKKAIVHPFEASALDVSVVTFTEHVKRYGLQDSVIHQYHAQRFESINHVGYSTNMDSKPFSFIDYGKACEILQKRSNAEIFQDSFVRKEGEIVELTSGLKLRARFVVDAMGLFSPLRDNLGLEKPDLRTALLFRKYKVSKVNSDTFSYVVGNGLFSGYVSNGGWIYPINNETVEIGSAFLLNDKTGTYKKPDESMYEKLEESLAQILSSFFPDAIPVSAPKTRITAYSPTKQVVSENVLFLGDVAGTGDPFLCANCSRYMEMSEVAVLSILKAVLLGNNKWLNDYQKQWNYELNSYCKRRTARAQILFKKTLKQWNKILQKRRQREAKKTLASRMGKLGYSLRYTLNRYSIFDVTKLLYRELRFMIKYRILNPKPVPNLRLEALHGLQYCVATLNIALVRIFSQRNYQRQKQLEKIIIS